MGGEIGRDISQAVLGFGEGFASAKLNQRMAQQEQQRQFAMAGAQDLAKRGELGNMPQEFLKPLEKYYGKEGMASLLKVNEMNQSMRLARKGAEQMVSQVNEQQQIPVPPEAPMGQPQELMQGPPEMTTQNVQRQATPQEAFTNFQKIGPLGVFLMTGDVQAGQLAQREADLAFEQMKYAEAPKRNVLKTLTEAQAKWATENRQSQFVSANQLDQIQDNNLLPEGFVGFKVGEVGVILQAPESIKINADTQTRLAAMGVKDVRNATPSQIKKALAESVRDSGILAGAGARAKAQAEKQMAEGSRLWDTFRQRAESTFNAKTGQLAPSSLTVGEADSKEWKVIPDKHRGVLQDIQQSRAAFSSIVQDFQSVYGKGGLLSEVEASLPSRTLAGAKAYWQNITQQNPTLSALSAQAGQLAQALNRGSYGGVGTQTENDRQFAMKALTSIADGSFLLDTPKVQQKKINDIMKRFNRIEGAILGNQGADFPGTVYMDITKPANQQLEWTTPPITAEQQGVQSNVQQPAQQAQQPVAQQPATQQAGGFSLETGSLEEINRQIQAAGGQPITQDVLDAYRTQFAGKKKL